MTKLSKMSKLPYSATALLCGLSISFTSCSWVGAKKESHFIALVKPSSVQHCRKIATTRSKSVAKVLFVNRSFDKVMSELITLAKNEALVLKGNTIVAEGPYEQGSQLFGIYDCPQS